MIKTGNLDNVGKHSNLMIGQMAMDNAHGKSNLQLGQAKIGGSYTNTAIGLMNLDSELANLKEQVPIFDNTNGQRLIAIATLDNEGNKSIDNVGEMKMINKGGKSDIQIKKAIAGGKGTLTNIGLLNLAEQQQPLMFQNVNGTRNILLKDFTAAGEKTTSNIGEMAMNNAKGTSNIQMMKAINSGKGSLVNIGLLNLAEAEAQAKAAPQKPMFMNVGGERMI